MTSEPAAPVVEEHDEGMVTFRVRRSMLYGVVGLLAGFGLGLGAARWFWVDRAVARALGGPPAAGAPIAAAGVALDTTPKVIETAARPSHGPANAAVTIVEFTDYQCPYCRQHYSLSLQPLLAKYGDRVRYVVMNYPLPSLHADATAAAEAAECAADQGRYWEYHDKLFKGKKLDRASLGRMAAQVNLDGKTFAACLDGGTKSALVQQQVALGNSLGISGTPTFFLNGRMLEGARPLPVIEQAIDKALAQARK